jgi:tetratricopeptide (TPR) repeat protein
LDYYELMSFLNLVPLLLALACAQVAQAQTVTGKVASSGQPALDGQLFYQLLLGELNARGDDPGAGYSLLLDAARKTNDPRLFQRAVDIALQARSGDSALLAARAWQQALPASQEANRYLLQILIGLNRLGEILELIKRELATASPNDRADAIAGIPRYFARSGDKKLAAAVVEQALSTYLSAPGLAAPAWTTIGRMHLEASDPAAALNAALRGQSMDPNSDGPARLGLSLMSTGNPQAESIVRKYLEGQPQPEFRMAYTRALLNAQRYAEAGVQLEMVTSARPDMAEAWLIRGALALQDNKLTAAEQHFTRYLDVVSAGNASTTRAEAGGGLTQAYLSLAQIAEQRKDWAAADGWLQRINRPGDMLNAQLRRAAILARQGQLEQARDLIRRQPEETAADARLKLTTEAQLLRDSKQFQPAYILLSEAVANNPTDLDLTYDLAMVAEKMGRFDEMERLLRTLMALRPSNAQAFNALGYSLAERRIRLPEAKQLILKALESAPGDPFITDSLGWVAFQSGQLEEARRILEGAYTARPDAEIAAHLGEVLWALGLKEQAIKIWREGLELNDDNETLQDTIKRLRVKL